MDRACTRFPSRPNSDASSHRSNCSRECLGGVGNLCVLVETGEIRRSYVFPQWSAHTPEAARKIGFTTRECRLVLLLAQRRRTGRSCQIQAIRLVETIAEATPCRKRTYLYL